MTSQNKKVRVIAPGTIQPERLKPVTNEVTLYDVYGIVTGTKTGRTNKGDWLQFKGEFRAVTPDGTIFEAGSVALEYKTQGLVLAALMQERLSNKDASIRFAARLVIVPPKNDKVSLTGFEYDMELISSPSLHDPLGEFHKFVFNLGLQLGKAKPSTLSLDKK